MSHRCNIVELMSHHITGDETLWLCRRLELSLQPAKEKESIMRLIVSDKVGRPVSRPFS